MTLAVDPLVWQLWGKADPKRKDLGPEWHPLLCHMIDVVACARMLLGVLYPERLASWAAALGLSEEDARAWILLAVGLHDLGKLTPSFQAKAEQRVPVLRALGLDFPGGEEPHGAMSAILAEQELARLRCPETLARGLAGAVAAHHGDFATSNHLINLEDDVGRNAGRKPLWKELRRKLSDALADLTGVSQVGMPKIPDTKSRLNAFYADVAGFTTVADWLGSNADVFGYVEPPANIDTYHGLAGERAREALAIAGFRRPPRPRSRVFVELFGRVPWPLHDAMAEVLDQAGPASMVIVEAPMGEGKTEAALLLYDALAARGAEGLYFALPTQATANQMLGRVEDYLAGSFPGETHGLHIIHGGAGLSTRYEALKKRVFTTRSVGDITGGGGEEGPVADAWFARPKRALLAPLAVGTVDQALLGVLRSRHHFLRLHGLARKVFVVDEVHAYDTFTSEILARLCAWLRALDGTVVLLSATLSSPQRAHLLRAFGVEDASAPPAYPRITTVRNGVVTARSFAVRRLPVEVKIEWKAADELARAVADVVRGGGCVAWIMNTVARAQRAYSTLKAMQARDELAANVELSLLHARFPFAARQARELAAEEKFGPPEKTKGRPRAAILVGTQVLEQSLDLDFDLMVTDLAPVDLVLQRAGRLHRHDRPRLRGLETPWLWIERPTGSKDGPSFGVSVYVYDEATLLRSWLALDGRSRVIIPTEIEPIVESVYAPTGEGALPAPIAARLKDLQEKREREARSVALNAGRRELPRPEDDSPFAEFTCRFDEEDPGIHEELRAVTRLGDPTVIVVPVISRDGRLVLASEPAQEVTIEADSLPYPAVLAIARQALSIGHRAVVPALVREKPPVCFQRSSHLRHHRLLRLDENGTTQMGMTRLSLDPELGLVVADVDPAATL